MYGAHWVSMCVQPMDKQVGKMPESLEEDVADWACRETARIVARSRNALQSHLQRQQDARRSPPLALWKQLPQPDSCAAVSCSPRACPCSPGAFPCSPRAVCCSPDCSPNRACDPGRPGDGARSHRASLPARIWYVEKH